MINKKVWACTGSEIRAGAEKYVEAIIHILEKMDKHSGPLRSIGRREEQSRERRRPMKTNMQKVIFLYKWGGKNGK